jgi:hypothetical protein
MSRFEELDAWELLGLAPGASAEEIRRAYERLTTLLAPGSLSLYSAAELEEQHRLQERLRAAYLSLAHSGAGLAHPSGVELAAAETVPPQHEAATMNTGKDWALASAVPPVVSAPDSGAEFSGAFLRAAREAAGISIEKLAERTRIRPQQLASLEAETFDALPPQVYVRGFVMAYARELGLDPERAWAGFLKRWRAARPSGPADRSL